MADICIAKERKKKSNSRWNKLNETKDKNSA